MSKKLLGCCAAFSAALLSSALSVAAGLTTDHHGARPLSMGNAMTALADDASTIFFNPAGIAQLSGWQIQAGVGMIIPSVGYSADVPGPNATTTNAKVDVSGKTLVFAVPSAYVSYRFHPRLAAGIGIYAPYGLGTHWPDTVTIGGTTAGWWGNQVSKESGLLSLCVNPVIAANLHPRLSIGGGLSVVYGQVNLSRVVAPGKTISGGTVVDDVLVDLSGSAIGFGGTAGLWFSAIPNYLQLGVAYRSGISMKYSGDGKFSLNGDAAALPAAVKAQLTDGPINVSIPFPHVFSVGVASRPKPEVTLTASVEVSTWNSVQNLAINFEKNTALSVSVPKNWKTTVGLHIGGEYLVRAYLPLRAGFVFDQSPVPSDTVGPELPDADRFAITLGGGYRWRKLSVDLGYMYVLTGNHNTAGKAIPSGQYRASGHFTALSLGYSI